MIVPSSDSSSADEIEEPDENNAAHESIVDTIRPNTDPKVYDKDKYLFIVSEAEKGNFPRVKLTIDGKEKEYSWLWQWFRFPSVFNRPLPEFYNYNCICNEPKLAKFMVIGNLVKHVSITHSSLARKFITKFSIESGHSKKAQNYTAAHISMAKFFVKVKYCS